MTFLWLLFFIFFLVLEAGTINLVSIWFAIGALVSAVIAFFLPDAISLQMSIFVLVSIVSLSITRPLIKKIRTKEKVRTNLDQVLGKTGVVTVPIEKHTPGEVKVLGKRWSAVCKENLAVGEEVNILQIEGVKLEVERK